MSSKLSEDMPHEKKLVSPLLSKGDSTGLENDETDEEDSGFLSEEIVSISTILFIRDWATIVFMVLVSLSWTRKFTRTSASVMPSDTWSNEKKTKHRLRLLDGKCTHLTIIDEVRSIRKWMSECNSSFVHRIEFNHQVDGFHQIISIIMIFTHSLDENAPSVFHDPITKFTYTRTLGLLSMPSKDTVVLWGYEVLLLLDLAKPSSKKNIYWLWWNWNLL